MKTLQELQDEAHATAVSKGWHEKPLCSRTEHGAPCKADHDRILAKHALIHSELTEAVECYADDDLALHYVDGKPEGFIVEAADVIIRILDTVGALGLQLARQTTPETVVMPNGWRSLCTTSGRGSVLRVHSKSCTLPYVSTRLQPVKEST